MQNNTIKSLTLGSYMLLSAYVGTAWGVLLGVLLFAGSFLSDAVNAMLPEDLVAGLPSGLACLLFLPPVLGLCGLFLGWASYPVFGFMTRVTDGLKISGEIEGEQESAISSLYAQRKRR